MLVEVAVCSTVQAEVERPEMDDVDAVYVEGVRDDVEMDDTFACAVRVVEQLCARASDR